MCAIFGIIGRSNVELLKKMSKCQLYRGPDSQTFFNNKKLKVSFGMNRLAVIDKKSGYQPMFSHDKRFLLVFNGTIYNFKEIKKFLEKKISFKTQSDTEVLINSYSYWGNKSFNYFDGMWAASIFDFKKKRMILSRDYVGQKPLFYYKKKEIVIFSSQLNGIFQYDNKFHISKKNYGNFLRFNHFPAPETLYQNINQVCPGEIIEFRNNRINSKKYWKVENGGDYNLFFPKRKTHEISKVFQKTTSNFLIADQKVGLCLSSGFDSNILKKVILKKEKKIKSFTIGFKDQTYDESKKIKKTPNDDNKKKILSQKDLIKTFHLIRKNIFFPIGDSSILPTFELFNLIKKRTNAVIGGDGGDEIFYGYVAFKGFYITSILKKIFPNFLLRIIRLPFKMIKISTDYLSWTKKIKFFFEHIDKELFLINNLWISNFADSDYKAYFKNKTIPKSKHLNKIKNLYNKSSDDMKFAQFYFIKYFLPNILLKVDFSSMLNSIECRSPYLTKDLLNYSVDLTSNKNFSFFKSRKLMKLIFSDLINKDFNMKKHGFAFNKNLILRNKDLILKVINKNLILNLDFFNKRYNEYLDGKYEHEQYLWNEIIINFCRQNLEYKL